MAAPTPHNIVLFEENVILNFLCDLKSTILYSVISIKPVLLSGGGRVTSSTTFLSDVEAGGKFVFPYVSTQNMCSTS